MYAIDAILNSYYLTRPDFVGILQRPGNDANGKIDIHDVVSIVELKHDRVKKSRAPDLHDPASETPLESTYARPQGENPNPRFKYLEQLLEYCALVLTAQAPHRRFIFGILVNHMRIQILYMDRGGCAISEEFNCEEDFSVLLGLFLALKVAPEALFGIDHAITRLDKGDCADHVICDDELDEFFGTLAGPNHQTHPFLVRVQSASSPEKHVEIVAHGNDLLARPVPCKETEGNPVQQLRTRIPLDKYEGERPGSSKITGRAQEAPAGVVTGISQPPDASPVGPMHSPRTIFGPSTVRFLCHISGRSGDGILQLSWERKTRVSEAVVLRLANELRIEGVPTLVGAYDIADLDEESIRSRLSTAFKGFTRATNTVCRALVFESEFIPLSRVTDIICILSAWQSIVRGE